MTETDDLIERLVKRRGTVSGRKPIDFALPLIAAGAASCLALMILLGLPFGSVAQTGWLPLVNKLGFSLTLTFGAALALYALAHPGQRSSFRLLLALVPLALVGSLAMLEFTGGLGGFPGPTWKRCIAAMLLLGSLGFASAIYTTRLLAPVRLRRAGFAAGLFGGGMAATAYAPFCPEQGAMHLMAFYGGPIMVLAAFGWLAGPKLLRW